MKALYASILLAASGVTIAAQESAPTPQTGAPSTVEQPVSKVVEAIAPCGLTIQHSPIVNGLKLRMPEAEAALKVGGKFEKDGTDAKRKRVEATLGKSPIFETDKIVSGTLTSVDDRVTSIKLTSTRPWTSAKEMVNAQAPKLGLVRIGFRLDDEKREAKIVCKDFTVELRAAGTGSETILTETSAAPTAAVTKAQ